MSFEHTRVEDIEKTTKAWLIGNENNPLIPMVDGIPVAPPLVSFCAEIRRVNRHVKFGVGRGGSRGIAQLQRALELYVYMEGHVYAMMKIGYADYSLKNTGCAKYMVYARNIQNDKFSDNKDQYYMATAENIDRAMKNVKKYMRPYAPIEVAAMTFDTVRQKFSSVVRHVSSTLYNAHDRVVNSSHLRNELFYMLDVGYEFLSEDFRNNLVVWREQYAEDQAARARALHVYYVNVRIHREEMMCDVIEVLDANNKYCLDPTDRALATVTYKMEDLPEHIGGGLAALSMVEDGHYVDGVGLRVDSSTFWVQR